METWEISVGVMANRVDEGRAVGINIDNAGNKIDLERALLGALPGAVESEAAWARCTPICLPTPPSRTS